MIKLSAIPIKWERNIRKNTIFESIFAIHHLTDKDKADSIFNSVRMYLYKSNKGMFYNLHDAKKDAIILLQNELKKDEPIYPKHIIELCLKNNKI